MILHYKYPLDYPLDTVWALISDFGNTDWAGEAIDKVEIKGQGIGMRRVLHWKRLDRPSIHRLEAIDHEAKTYSYSIPDSHVRLLDDCRIDKSLKAIDDRSCLLCVDIVVDTEQQYLLEELNAVLKPVSDNIIGLIDQHLSANSSDRA